jgi:putative ATP-binding cassette transporter
VSADYRFSEERLALLWRTWLTRGLLTRYLAQRAYHQLEASNQIANPDERIADDTRAFAGTTLSFMLMSLNAGFTVVAFAA